MAEAPADWRELVTPLIMPEAGTPRQASVMAAHSEALNRFSYIDTSTVSGIVILTKARFISWQRNNEGYGTDSASESFERRLEEASSEHLCSEDDQPQVKVRENTRVECRRGTVTESRPKGRNSTRATRNSTRESRPRGHARGGVESNRSSNGSRRLGRSRSRHARTPSHRHHRHD